MSGAEIKFSSSTRLVYPMVPQNLNKMLLNLSWRLKHIKCIKVFPVEFSMIVIYFVRHLVFIIVNMVRATVLFIHNDELLWMFTK